MNKLNWLRRLFCSHIYIQQDYGNSVSIREGNDNLICTTYVLECEKCGEESYVRILDRREKDWYKEACENG